MSHGFLIRCHEILLSPSPFRPLVDILSLCPYHKSETSAVKEIMLSDIWLPRKPDIIDQREEISRVIQVNFAKCINEERGKD